MIRIALMTAFGTLVGSSCAEGGTHGTTPSPAGGGSEIVVENIAFKPPSLVVRAGGAVLWRNEDGGVAHTVTAGTPGDKGIPGVREPKPHKLTGLFDGELDDAGASFTFTFERSGTYSYFCEIHPSMTGEIVVD
jgi:manganese oxidase